MFGRGIGHIEKLPERRVSACLIQNMTCADMRNDGQRQGQRDKYSPAQDVAVP